MIDKDYILIQYRVFSDMINRVMKDTSIYRDDKLCYIIIKL